MAYIKLKRSFLTFLFICITFPNIKIFVIKSMVFNFYLSNEITLISLLALDITSGPLIEGN